MCESLSPLRLVDAAPSYVMAHFATLKDWTNFEEKRFMKIIMIIMIIIIIMIMLSTSVEISAVLCLTYYLIHHQPVAVPSPN